MSSNNTPLSGNPLAPLQRVSLNSAITNVILDSDTGNSSLVIRTGTTNSLYIDKYSNVGINTNNPTAQFEIASTNGSCLRLRYGTSSSAYSNIFTTSGGDLSINSNSGSILLNSTVSITGNLTVSGSITIGGGSVATSLAVIDPTAIGVAAAGKALIVDSNRDIINIHKIGVSTLSMGSSDISTNDAAYISGLTAGTAANNKALILNGSGTISGITSLSATSLTGTLQTAAQPNITSLGTLTALTSSGIVSLTNTTDASSSINGGALTVSGGFAVAKSVYIGGNLTVSGTTTTVNSSVVTIADNTLLLNASPTGPTDSGVLVNRYQTSNDSGLGSIITDTPNLTTTITSATTLTVVLASGSSVDSYYNGWWLQTGTQSRKVSSYVGSTRTITISSAFTSTPTNGASIQLFNHTYAAMVWNETNKRFQFAFAANDATTLSIIDDAPLRVGALTTNSVITITNTTDSTSITTGSLITSGGIGITKNLYVGTGIYGTMQTASQPNITSLGTLIGATISNPTNAALTLTSDTYTGLIGVSGSGASSNPLTLFISYNGSNRLLIDSSGNIAIGSSSFGYKLNVGGYINATALYVGGVSLMTTLISGTITAGTATASKALSVDANLDISGIRNITITGSLTLGSTAFGSTELGYLSGASAGSITAGKVIIADSNKSISGLTALTLSNTVPSGIVAQTFTSDTYSFVNGVQGSATSISANSFYWYFNGQYRLFMNSSGSIAIGFNTITGSTFNYKMNINGSMNATSYYLSGTQINLDIIMGPTAGTASASRALIVDASRNITNINSLTTTGITIGSVALTATNAAFITDVSPGTVASGKAIIADVDTMDVVGIGLLSVDTLLVGGNEVITSNDVSVGYMLNVVPGTATATTALVTNANIEIAGLHKVGIVDSTTAGFASITLNSSAQTLIIGTRGSTNAYGANLAYISYGGSDQILLNSSGNIAIGTTSISTYKVNINGSLNATSYYIGGSLLTFDNLSYINGITTGTASASKALVLNASSNISGINSLGTSSLTVGATTITNQLAYITVATLGAAEASKMLTLDSSKQITGITSLATTTLVLNSNSISSEAVYIAGATKGTATAGKMLVASDLNSIIGINALGVSSLTSSGTITIGSTNITTAIAGYLANITAGSATASTAVILDSGKGITGIGTIGVSKINISGSSISYVSTSGISTENISTINAATITNTDAISTDSIHRSMMFVRQLTMSSANAITTTTASTLRIEAAPISAGSMTIGSRYALYAGGPIYTVGTSTFVVSTNYERVQQWTSDNAVPISVEMQIHSGSGGTSTNNVNFGTYTANDLSFITNNTKRATISATGKFGIGNVSPAYTLDITGSVNIASTGNQYASAWTESGLIFANATYTNTTTANGQTDNITRAAIYIGSPTFAATNTAVITTTASTLYVNGPPIDGTNNTTTNRFAIYAGGPIYVKGISTFLSGSYQSTQLWSNDNASAITAELRIYNGSNATSTNSVLFGTTSTNTLSLMTNGSARLNIDSSGNVGIGISPSYKLDISGDINLTGGIRIGGVVQSFISTTQSGYLSIATIGTAEASKALILDASRNITNINSLTATTITGTLQTAAQTNITSIGTLTGLTSSGAISITNTTASSSTSTGALVVSGGVGIGGKLYTGSSIASANNAITITNTNSTGLANMLFCNDSGSNWEIGSRGSAASAYPNGFYIYSGGWRFIIQSDGKVGIGITPSYKLDVNGDFNCTAINLNATQIVDTSRNVLNINNLTTGGVASFTNTTTSSSSTTGALIVSGGAGIAGNLNIGTGSKITCPQIVVTSYIQVGTSTDTSRMISCLDSTMANAAMRYISLGKASSANNQAELAYYHAGDGSTSNQFRIGRYGGTMVYFQFDGKVGFGVSSPSYAIDVSGDINLSGSIRVAGVAQSFISTTQAGYLSIATIGTAEASKALILDTNKDITSIRNLTATNLTGTLQTAAQTNITSVGTLDSLAVTNGITASTLTGMLQTAAQTNITSVGTLGSLAVTNGITASTLTGTLQTAAQTNITSVGTLTSLMSSGTVSITNTTDASSAANGGALTIGGGLGVAKSVYIGGNLTVNGTTITVNSSTVVIDDNTIVLNASPTGPTDSGILVNRYQTSNDTGLGSVVTDTPNLTTTVDSATTLTVVLTSGSSVDNYYNGWWLQTGTQVRQVSSYVGSTKTITISSAFTSTPTNGATIQLFNHAYAAMVWDETNNRFQCVFTANDATTLSIIDDASLRVGALTTSDIATITSTTDSTSTSTGSLITSGGVGIAKTLYVGTGIYGTLQTAAQTNITSVGTLGSLAVTNGITATNLTGTLQTAAQTNITSVGTLTSLTSSGAVSITNATDSSSTITGSLIISGGAGIAKTLYVGTGIYGTLQTAAQTNITSVGTLTSLTSSGAVSITNATDSSSTITGSLIISGGVGIAKKLYVGTGIYGTLQTAAQTNITSVGTLTGLTSSGAISITSTTASSSSTTGALIVSGGAGIAGNLNIGAGNTITSPKIVATSYIQVGTSTDTSRLISATDSAMGNGDLRFITVGKYNTVNNQAEFYYYHSSDGSSSNQCRIGGNGGAVLYVQFNGHVGISNSSPGYTLDVSGDINLTGNITSGGTNVLDTSRNLNNINKVTTNRINIGNQNTGSSVTCYIDGGTYSGNIPSMTNYYYVNFPGSSWGGTFTGTGNPASALYVTGQRAVFNCEVDFTSDIRIKKDIEDIDTAFAREFIQKSQAVKFRFKTEDSNCAYTYGFIAQEMIKNGFRDLFSVNEYDGKCGDLDSFVDGYEFEHPTNVVFNIPYVKIIPILAQAQKDSYTQIAELKEDNIRLTNELNDVKIMLAELAKRMDELTTH